MLNVCRLPAIVLVALLALPAVAQSKDPAVHAPADALFFLGITDFEEMWKAYEKTAGYQMLQDPIAKDAMQGADLMNRFGDKVKERLSKVLGIPAAQMKNPFKGAIALWVTPPTADDGEPEPGLVAGVGDAEAMRKYYDAAVRKLKEAAGGYEAVSAGSNSIDVFRKGGDDDAKSEEDEEEEEDLDLAAGSNDPFSDMIEQAMNELFSADAMPPTLAMCLTDEALFVGASADAVKDALRRDRSGKTLAEHEDYKNLEKQLKTPGQVRMFVNVPALVEMEARKDADFAKTVNAMGLKAMRGIIGHIHVGGDDYQYKIEALVQMSGERSGITRMLSMDNRAVAPGAGIPGDAIGFFSVNINIMAMLEESERIMRATDPDTADQFRASLDSVPTPDGETMSPRKDVIEHLREPITLFFGAVRPYAADSARALLAIGHRNRAAMEKFLGFLQNAAGGMLAARELRGTQMLDSAFGGVSMAVLSDQFIAGNTAAVESAAGAAGGEGIASDATFKDAARHVPSEAWGVFYVDSRRMWDAMIGFSEKKEELQSTGGMDAGAGVAMLFAGLFEGQIKTGKLEEARKLAKYQAPQIFTLTTTPEGVRLVGVQCKPKAE
ncbi:MAG: hypothetical protein HRU75_06150 [Planctomycetia bacterium]|nr:MAG: hypothetical protein HRU75_06150 [Planctomycetia bacterium]